MCSASFAQQKIESWEELFNNSRSLYKERKYQQAIDTAEKALTVSDSIFGMYHENSMATINHISGIYWNLELVDRFLMNEERALPRHEYILAQTENELGMDHPDLINLIGNVAGVHRGLGNYHKALEYNQRRLSLMLKYNVSADKISLCYFGIGNIYKKLGKLNEAEDVYKQMCIFTENQSGYSYLKLCSCWVVFGRFLEARQKFDEAELYFKKALDTYENNQESIRPSIILYLNILANHYIKRNKFNEAETLLVQAEILADSLDSHPKYLGITYRNMGLLSYKKESYSDAEHYYMKSMSKIMEYNHSYELKEIYKIVSELYFANGQNNKAKYYKEKADSIIIKKSMSDKVKF